jgi:NAD(P)-dependent dehydrogenase (short-subunit alcohol dehydrogenase family)
MLLAEKNAVVYGAGGAVGGSVAAAFAREGARVFLTGRTRGPLDAVAQRLRAAGAAAEVATVDALDEEAVVRHAASVVEAAGGIDISFNAIAVDHRQIALADLSVQEIVGPVADRVATHLITARAAARHMTGRGAGVVLTFTADAARLPYPNIGSFGIACAGVEALSRSLAAELGPSGVRVVCLRSMGSPESPGVEDVWAEHFGDDSTSTDEVNAERARGTLLRRVPTLAEVGNVAALMASDMASPLTAVVVNVACGEIAD